MRLMLKTLLPAVLLLTTASHAAAQTADELVEKSLAATGGRAALAKLTSRSTTGKITVSTPNGDFSGTIEAVNESPNKVRTLITLDLSAAGMDKMTIEQRFNGTSGYAMNSMQGDSEITGAQIENMRNSVFPTPFVGYKERGAKIEVKGKQKIGDRDAYELVITPSAGSPSHVFLDAESYLAIRAVIVVSAPEVGTVEQTTDFSDFRDVDGVKVPFRLKASSAMQNYTIDITKVEHNLKIDPALFEKTSK
jgi:outer membrane lipoprotein-sorting protein